MIANYHTHTWRCNHAVGTEQEYVENALKSGIKILGFSDHTPYFFPGDYYSHFRMRPEQMAGYVDTVLELRETYRDRAEIHLGLETEYYPDLFSELLEFLEQFPVEYLILGQHILGNEVDDFYSGRQTEDAHILERYCRQSMEAMNTGRFTYFAHPDLIHYVGEDSVYREHMRNLCREANRCHMPLEINLLGLAEGKHYPREAFWQVAAEENCRVILGRDAHKPEAFLDTRQERRALDMVERLGLHLVDRVEFSPVHP